MGLRSVAMGLALFAAVIIAPWAAKSALAAGLPTGKKTIELVTAGGERVRVGSVEFSGEGDTREIKVDLDAPEFGDEFLSMRPFRCLPDANEMWCHLIYPYILKDKITAKDLKDLEYRLLFIFRSPNSYGIDAWNGLYFKLALGDDGTISGPVNEVDLNILAVPPEDKTIRPIGYGELNEVEGNAHRFARVEIK